MKFKNRRADFPSLLGVTHFLCIGGETRNEAGFWVEKCGFAGKFEGFGGTELEQKVRAARLQNQAC